MKESLVLIKLSDIESNPNRDLLFNPFNEEKITALMASIRETGFWTNVILRPHPTKKGKYQQSYGHHRMEAARRCWHNRSRVRCAGTRREHDAQDDGTGEPRGLPLLSSVSPRVSQGSSQCSCGWADCAV